MKIHQRMLVLITGLVCTLGYRAIAEEATQATTGDADGWITLFDGHTLQGWSVKSGYATYRVLDDAIVGKTAKDSPNTFLVSEKTFGDFELVLEVFLDDAPLNSGVQNPIRLEGG